MRRITSKLYCVGYFGSIFVGAALVIACCFLIFLLVTGRRTPGPFELHRAITKGDMAAVDELLDEYGVNPNVVDQRHVTALHVAARKGNLAACRKLIQHGAIVDHRDMIFGFTPLHYAILLERRDCIPILITPKSLNTGRFKDGATPLHLAVMYGDSEACRMLISAGASLLVMDEYGVAPIDVLVKLLMGKRALSKGMDRAIMEDF